MKKLTPWYSGRIKPVREGVYMIKEAHTGYILYAAWCGDMFGWSPERYTIDLASQYLVWIKQGYQRVSLVQDKVWRGLAEKP